MREKALENKIKKHLESKGYWFIKVHGSSIGKSGIPDIIACIEGVFVALEIKNPNGKGKISELQKYNISKINDSGGEAFIIDSFEDYLEKYEEIIANNYIRR